MSSFAFDSLPAVGPDRLLLLHSDSQPVARAIRAAVSRHGWDVQLHHGTVQSLAATHHLAPAALIVVVAIQVGIALAMSRELRAVMRTTPVVFMSRREHAEAHEVIEVIREGAWGWLTLDMDPMRIPHALEGVMDGEPALPRQLMAGVIEKLRHERSAAIVRPDGRAAELTRREMQAAHLIARGMTTAGAADIMQVSQTTVRGYLTSVRRKLDVEGREQIARVIAGMPTPSTGV